MFAEIPLDTGITGKLGLKMLIHFYINQKTEVFLNLKSS